MERGRRNLADRLRGARETTFVGRSEELAAFHEALGGRPGAAAVLYVHGPGGVGKSALLRRFADESRDAGRTVVEVDGRLIDPSPDGFAAGAAPALTDGRPVLLVDTFEHCQGLEDWLRDRFLPRLPERAVVVIAGREPPSPLWAADLAWNEALRVIGLGPLAAAEAEALLERRGVGPSQRPAVLAFAGGHPLALSLAAAVAVDGAGGASDWAPAPDVLSPLLSRIVGEVPSPVHRLALEVAAHTMTTTESLLRAVVGEERAGEMFAWLRELPFADRSRHGLFLHDLVRDAVDADLRWRDPQGYAGMHHRVGAHLLEQARTADDADAVVALRALAYLNRYGPTPSCFSAVEREGDAYEDTLRPGDGATVLAMAAGGEGSAAATGFWLERQPEAFRVYRSTHTGEAVAFMTRLRLAGRRGDECAADPVVAAAWEHAERENPPPPGGHLMMSRFMAHPAVRREASSAMHLMQLRMCADWIRSDPPAWSFVATPRPGLWGPLLEHLGHHPAAEASPGDGHTCALFACDWRTTPVETWFDRSRLWALTGDRGPADRAGDAGRALTRMDFDNAVRSALRDWHRPDALEANPLLRTRMVADRAGAAVQGGRERPAHAAEMLRDLLTDAVDALREDPRQAKFHRVVATTYFHKVPSQMAAAERLRLPFSTYRRHLRRGVERVSALLWRREAGTPLGPVRADGADPAA